MSPKRIFYREGRTINMGNYESIKVEIEMESETTDDTPEGRLKALKSLRDEVRTFLDREARLFKKRGV